MGEKQMSSIRTNPRGLYFEEFEAGQRITSAGRTVTESDVVSFAGLSGDFNQIHTDAEYSQNTPYKERVAHGLLALSMASGLAVQTGVLEGTILAFREISEWKFVKPVFIGDTIHVQINIEKTKALPRLGGGIILIELDVLNQKDEIVMKGNWKVLVAGKGASK
jgi:3-hydroxybutyryl-CoA dehydratase